MARKGNPPENVGKGKITPVQIAFIVARYLSDNNFDATSAAFRSDASHLLSRTRDKEVPKGLLSLDDILDEYIRLKEQKVAVDQEKRKVEVLLQGIQDAVQVYHSSANPPVSNLPLSTKTGLYSASTLLPQINSFGTFPGSVMSVPSTLSEPSMISAKSQNQSYFSAPTINSTSKSKRKPSKTAQTAPPAPKKARSQKCGNRNSSISEGNKALPLQVTGAMNSNENAERSSAVQLGSSDQSTIQPAVHGSSVAKNLFKHTPESRVKSTSPKTPQNNLPSNSDESDTPMDVAFLANTSIDNFPQEMSASKTSVVSSKAVVISPLKHSGYHSMERSHCLSVSPVRSSPSKNSRKNRAKGRLNFNSSKTSPETNTSTSMSEALQDPMFDLDLPDFDVDFSFSQLLVDLEFPCAENTTTCRKSSNYPAHIIPWSKPETTRVSETTKTGSFGLPNITKVVTEEDENISGEDECNSSGAEEENQV